jgi:FlaA1/EpsC-like NDP-sugar epimerase
VKSGFTFRNRIVLLGDLFLIAVSVLGSFVLRLNFGTRLADFQKQIATMILIAWIVKPLVYYRFGLYRRVWAYASVNELKQIAAAVTVASVVMFAIFSVIQVLHIFRELPRLAVPIDWLLSLVAVGGLRFALRIWAESQAASRSPLGRAKRVLVVGAGDAGALVVREIQKSPMALQPVCFVDDDPAKQKLEIYGVRVAVMLKDIAHLAETYHIDEVFIAIPSASGQVVRNVTEICRLRGIPFRTMPSLNELFDGKISVSRLREVEITDLLRREPVKIDDQLVGQSLNSKRVLVTGAGGSIGRELCRQVARWKPAELVLLGHGENSIFETLLELEESFPALMIRPIIADIRDRQRLDFTFGRYQPQVIFHAAAHKHVPLMQVNVEDAITNNVLGTCNVVEAALSTNVDRLVMISTDKAVCPSSVYGASKRLAEMLVLDAARRTDRAFSVVRFGNVLGSRGSIIPLFKRQIASGGPVTITHPDMYRYFMTIPEAVHLVLQAFAMGQGSEVFVLNMGEQIRILSLAEDLIRLSGLEPRKDIEIVFTGIRPGEKLREALWDEGAAYQPTLHPDVLRLADNEVPASSTLSQAVEQLHQLAQAGEATAIINMLDDLIPGATIRAAPQPDITAIM